MSDRPRDDTPPRSESDVFDIGKTLVSIVADEQTAAEFEETFTKLAGEPRRRHDASFFSGVGLAERALQQRREVANSVREADPEENTVPSVRVSQVRDGADGPTQAITVVCSDPDAKFSLSNGSLELYSPKHDYTDPIRVPFDEAVLRVSDTAEIAEATVIDASQLPDRDQSPATEREEMRDVEDTTADRGKWYAEDPDDE